MREKVVMVTVTAATVVILTTVLYF